jgi:hypothetical protein
MFGFTVNFMDIISPPTAFAAEAAASATATGSVQPKAGTTSLFRSSINSFSVNIAYHPFLTYSPGTVQAKCMPKKLLVNSSSLTYTFSET